MDKLRTALEDLIADRDIIDADEVRRLLQKQRSYQSRVAEWLYACFGPDIAEDQLERGDRFLEEVFELLQSCDYPRERIAALETYVWNRPKGEPHQEVGGVAVTFAAFCYAHGISLDGAAEAELARIWTKVEQIKAKQAAKPVGSALPIETRQPDEQAAPRVIARLHDFILEHELTCPESFYQRDAPQVAGMELLGELFDMVGYIPNDEDEDYGSGEGA